MLRRQLSRDPDAVNTRRCLKRRPVRGLRCNGGGIKNHYVRIGTHFYPVFLGANGRKSSQSLCIHHICSLKGSLADRRDLASPNTHRPHSVQPALRVDQPAVINRDIVGLRRLTTGNEQQHARGNERSKKPTF